MNHEHSLNFPVYPETCKNGQQSVLTCHLSPSSCGLYPASSNSKGRCVAVMLPENAALPKTFHPTDELAAQWKRIGPERDLSQPRISSAKDIISQAGIASQVYLRIISLPGISKLPQDIHANEAIWSRCLFREVVTADGPGCCWGLV